MKKLALILCILLIVSCKEDQKDYALVSGAFKNTKAKEVIISKGETEFKLAINDDGTFSDTLKIEKPGFYNFSADGPPKSVYIDFGDNLKVIADAKSPILEMTFEGEGAIENNYLSSKVGVRSFADKGAKALFSLDEVAFRNKIESDKNENLKTLSSIEGIDSNFKTLEETNLKYETLTLYNDYQNGHRYFTNKREFEVSEDFLPQSLKDMVFDSGSDYENSEAYKKLALNTSLDATFKDIESFSNIKPADLTPISEIKIQALKNDVISYVGTMIMSPANANMKDIYQFFSDNSTDPETKKILTNTYNKNKNLLKGMPSPKFVNYENNAGGETSLDDLKGKYVYVDVWATWCGPCIGEIPSLKKVEKQYHGKNIEFVSASIDTPNAYDKWKSMIKEKELGGTQLLADNAWQSKFVQDYAIDGIPRFILIDPDGNIISADAPRPSNPELVSMLDSELDKTK
ncbi:TlpA family protein disulfide reductase [Winogradskyella haliclonae]|uniref:Thioredoxin domain-containing protein n=1 Tax=Winogradskyella haliclonae TaxID=2048558 RepID=A0ABQ2BYM1_9FLAO|nr:TlpA disulfide reductase family protein [Winogradskyella haliclonae]GGI57619.1 hypothetical protein GCM10011444_19280 [Winogradskyella haliclonae]